MAVYTALDAADVERVLGEYGTGPLQRFSPIAEGIENTNYRVSAGNSEYVLTVYERSPRAHVEAVLCACETLADRGVPTPRPERTRDGAVLVQFAGRPVSLVGFVAGATDLAPDELHLETLGGCMARLHLRAEDLSLPGRAHLPEVLLPRARALAARLAEHPALAALLNDESRWQSSRLPEPELPTGLIHTDLFRDNVLFAPRGGRVLALLDFHLAGRGAWLFDLAVALLDWCWGERGLDGALARALLRGYRGVRPPSGAEYRHLPVLMRRAALRYLCLRCERFLLPDRQCLSGKAKDPLEFAGLLEAMRGGAGAGS